MQGEKLIYTNERLGAKIVANGQPTERLLFDTVATTVAPLSTGNFEFFSNTANKTPAESNFQQGILDNGESMVLKGLSFTDRASAPNNVSSGSFGLINIKVGQQTVVKDLPLNIGQAVGDLHIENIGRVYSAPTQWHFRLLTDIVVPPEVTLQVSLLLSNGSAVDTKAYNLECNLRGLGVLFNPNVAL